MSDFSLGSRSTSAQVPLTDLVVFIYRSGRFSGALRRVVDLAIATILLAASVPIVALAAAAILIEDGAPIFFSQRRVGLYERPFTILKLRTMTKRHCGSQYKPASGNDSRITKVGRFLRSTSIDELPQLLNVLRGDMTMIGPRPEMPFIVDGYQNWQHLRHLVRPGLTCIWQAYHRSIPLHHASATLLDLLYIRTASLRLDCKILLQTAVALLRRKGAV